MRPDIAAALEKRQAKKAWKAQNRAYIEALAAVAGKEKPKRKTRRKKYRAPTRRERDAYEATAKKFVEWRAMGLCDVCKINQGYSWYHIIPANEGQWAKWSIENIVWGCRECNCKENKFRAKYVDLHRMIFGYEFYAMLREKSNKTVQFRGEDFKRMREALEQKMASGLRNGLVDGGTQEAA